MYDDIDQLLKEKYDNIKVPEYMFKVNFKEFRKRIFLRKSAYVFIILSVLLTFVMIATHYDIDNKLTHYENIINYENKY